MSGFYTESIKARRALAFEDVRRVSASLAVLKNHDSEYAQEHRALISILQAVADIYESAPMSSHESSPTTDLTGTAQALPLPAGTVVAAGPPEAA